MPKRGAIANKRTQNKKFRTLRCVICGRIFRNILALSKHTRSHPPPDDSDSGVPQPSASNLLSTQQADPIGTVFEFSNAVNDNFNDDDNDADDYNDDADDDDADDDDDDADDNNKDDSDSSDDTDKDTFAVGAFDDDNDDSVSTDDCDEEEHDENSEEDSDSCAFPVGVIPPVTVSDSDVPYTWSSSASEPNQKATTAFRMQIEVLSLFNKNKASLKLYDQTMSLFNMYIASQEFNKHTNLVSRKTLLSQVETDFKTADMKPTYGSVRLHNNSLATVPVFDMKAMILSIVHDETLMRDEHIAEGYDIFTGDICNQSGHTHYGEIHTGKAWNDAKEAYCGEEGKYMPFAIVIFADKSHTDQHGALSVTPITFTPTFFNRKARNNPRYWRPIAYIPNLAYGKGQGGKSLDKAQDEHNCIAYAFKSLIDLFNHGGIKTKVMGRDVHMKIWIHFFIGDTEGHNKWLGHYNTSNSGVQRPYRDCHCTYADMNCTKLSCIYSTIKELKSAEKLIWKDYQRGKKKFKAMSRHYLTNALFQPGLPLSDLLHGANKMQPPEMLHTSDAGLIMYMQESLQLLLPGGMTREDLDKQHVRMSAKIRRQSDRDFPRGSIRNGLIESTRCQSSERKGNFFYLMCIANTSSGELILKHQLNFTDHHWLQWRRFLQLYLSMEAWFHGEIPLIDIEYARDAISHVLSSLQLYFPRQSDSNGYNIPKMHGMAKMLDYAELFGSAINFYGGPGEASHKNFVKAPGLKTQRRMGEFASQTAGQYYNAMMVEKAMQLVRCNRKSSGEHEFVQSGDRGEDGTDNGRGYEVMCKYTLDLCGMIIQSKNEHINKHGLHPKLLHMLQNKQLYDDDDTTTKITGYTRASVFDEEGMKIKFNAHPWYHGAPWYDWAWVDFVIEQSNGETSREYYPSMVLGFVMQDNDGPVQAVVHCSEQPVEWSSVESDFFVQFKLGSELDKSCVSVPLSALIHPICVIPNYGAKDASSYIVILPQRYWSKYFSSFVQSFA